MSDVDGELGERMTDLEVKLAYQEHTIATLDEVVRGLFTRLAAVEKELRELRASLAQPEPTLGPANEPPPHY